MQKFYQVISLLSLLLFLLFKLNVTNFVGQEGASLLNRVIPVNYHFKFFLKLQLSRIYKYKSLKFFLLSTIRKYKFLPKWTQLIFSQLDRS